LPGTLHYDGVKSRGKQPAVIALFGIVPAHLKLSIRKNQAGRKV